jgi:hypothetical protein
MDGTGRVPRFSSVLNDSMDSDDLSPAAARSFADSLMDMSPEAYQMIKTLTMKTTILPLSSLPFPEEDLLWKWATTPNSQCARFMGLLSRFYANNAVSDLPDSVLFFTFFQRWKTHDRAQPEVLELLHIFMETMDQTDDRLARALSFPVAIERLERRAEVRLAHGDARYRLAVPRSIRIGGLLLVLVHEVADFQGVDPGTLRWSARGVYKKATARLFKLLDQNIDDFTVLEEGSSSLHERDCVASVELARDDEIVDFLLDSLDRPQGPLAYELLVPLPRAAFPLQAQLSNSIDVGSVFASRLFFYDFFTAESFAGSAHDFTRLLEIANSLEPAMPLNLEIVILCCEVVCVVARKSAFGGAKQMVFELLLKWLQILAYVKKVARCFSFFFEREETNALVLPTPTLLSLLNDANRTVCKTARAVFDWIDIPLSFFHAHLEGNVTDDILRCLCCQISRHSDVDDAEDWQSAFSIVAILQIEPR